MGDSTRKLPQPALPETNTPRRVHLASNKAPRYRTPFSLRPLVPQPPTTNDANGHTPFKARVAPALARVAPPAPRPITDPLATRVITPNRTTKRLGHARQPLFVLSTARRRRARSNGPRGGYYALSITRKPRSIPRPISWFLGVTAAFMLFVLLSLLTLGAAAYGAYAYIAKDLPSVDEIKAVKFETTRIYDRYGALLYEMYDQNQGKRTYVTIDKMPPALIAATIAVEDKSFEQNSGVDPEGIARAIYINLTDKGSSGGSTITQQVVRLILLPERDERTFTRKVREAILALQVTQKYSKEKILEIYLNEIYYGSLSYGVSAAAETYFGKRVEDLSLAQSSMLAGLPQLPGQYDPNINFDLARARQKIVLSLMVKNKYITLDQADKAYAEDVRPIVRAANVPRNAPHFVQYVRQVLIEKYGPDMANRGGLKVFTTIDLKMQAEAQRIAAQQIDNIRRQGASNAGLVAINPRTGEILAMVGSVDYTDPVFGEFNVATSLRQPGSSFKPITYATGFQRGDFTPASIVPDLPAKYTNGAGLLPYIPQNYDGRFHGPVTIRSALANSFNIPAVEMLQAVGVPAVLDTAHRMGITTLTDPERYGLSLTLGGGEVTLLDMTSAFGTFANYGYRANTTPFLKIADSNGVILEELDPWRPEGNQALDPGVAYQISNILSDNAARAPIFGPNSPLKIDGIEAAAKTGTTNDWKDSWTMGYTPALAVGVWVGNNNGKPMAHVAGAIGAAPIWHDFIQKVYTTPELKSLLYRPTEKEVPEKFVPPAGMVRSQVCAVSGMAPGPACTNLRTEWFTEGNLPREECTWHKWVAVTLNDGGAAQAGPGVPKSNTIERIYTFAPAPFTGWIGGGPPKRISTVSDSPPPLPTPVLEEPPSVAQLITPVANTGLPSTIEPGTLNPIPGLALVIYSPTEGQLLSGPVVVLGDARADTFSRYFLEYGPGTGETGMTLITESATPTDNGILGILGTWNTGGLAPGPYTLRLTLETTTGDTVRTQVRLRVGSGVPSVAITSPTDGSPVYNGEAIGMSINPDGGGSQVAGVEVYVDNRRISSLLSPPWSVQWTVLTGTHELKAVMYTTTGEQAQSAPVYVSSIGIRPTPTPTREPIVWISNLTLYKEIPVGVNEVWVDVEPNSLVEYVNIYVDGFPAGFATGPGYRVNPNWTPTPTPPGAAPPTATLNPEQAAIAAQASATAQVEQTRSARAAATRTARALATTTALAISAERTAQSANATSTILALTATSTPQPPTNTPLPSPTPTFVRHEKLPDPMLGDYIARVQFSSGRHRVTAIGYTKDNRELARNETWVIVK